MKNIHIISTDLKHFETYALQRRIFLFFPSNSQLSWYFLLEKKCECNDSECILSQKIAVQCCSAST